MILTVTLNASVDKRYVISGLKTGEVNRVENAVYSAGGKGLNVSRAAVLAGAQVTATGFAGGHAGAFIEEEAGKQGIIPSFVKVEGESRSCVNIYDTLGHVQTELLEPGFPVSQEDQQEFLGHYKALLPGCSVAVISGSAPKGTDEGIYAVMAAMAKDAGKKVIVDASGNLLANAVQAGPSLVKPNVDEIRWLTGRRLDNEAEIARAAMELKRSGVETAVISLGKKGSLMACEKGIYKALVPELDTVNSVGCGDSMIAGFAVGMERKMEIEDSLKLASAISAANALQEKTGWFDRQDVERLWGMIEVKKIG